MASLLFKVRRKKTPAMTTNLLKADTDTLETLLQKESALYREALRNDLPFKFIKAIHLRIKCLSTMLLKTKPAKKSVH